MNKKLLLTISALLTLSACNKEINDIESLKEFGFYKDYKKELKTNPESKTYADLELHYSWFDSTPWNRVTNDNERQKLWQSEKRCCESKSKVNRNFRIYYKACHNGILEYPNNANMVVTCLWTMGFEETKDKNEKILKFINDNYFFHESRIDNCYNCKKADTIARSAGKLSYYIYKRDLNEAIEIIKEVINKRQKDISPWVQLDLLENLLFFFSQNKKLLNKQNIEFLNKTLIYATENTNEERDKKRAQKIKLRIENINKK